MNLTFRRQYLVAFIALCFVQIAPAQSSPSKVNIHLDPQKTEIHWTLGTTLHTVHGTFRLKAGMMTFDPATGAAEGEVLVDTSTGESGNSSRDGKMQKEVLESSKYPQAFFHPMKLSGGLKAGGPQNVTVEGTFNLRGADHPLTLQMTVQVNGSDATATTHFNIPYIAWGMKDESTFLLKVDKEVAVEVVAKGTVDGLSPAK